MGVYDTDMEIQENKNIMATASAGVWNMQLRACGNISYLCHMIIDTDV